MGGGYLSGALLNNSSIISVFKLGQSIALCE